MPLVIPSLLKLIGQGFEADAYAADGNHLRWMFDPRLGFPRRAFCLERRPALGTPIGNEGVKLQSERFLPEVILVAGSSPAQTVPGIVRNGLAVRRQGASLTLTADGIALGEAPLVVDFHGGSSAGPDPQAVYVRLTFTTYLGSSSGTAVAQYNDRGDFEDVDRASFASRRRFPEGVFRPELVEASDRIASLLERPSVGRTPPRLLDAETTALYRKLVASDPTRFTRTSPEFLRSVLDALKAGGVGLEDFVPRLGIRTTTTLELRADRIDRISIVGKSCSLLMVQWCTTEALMAARGWQPVGCYPLATGNGPYVETNRKLFDGADFASMAKGRALEPTPHGAEPLDDPQVPPSRPPTNDEIVGRYVKPWLGKQEPWLDKILSDSLAGTLHQAEVEVAGELSHLGQKPEDPFPTGVPGVQTASIRPYGMLLIAACAFPTAKVMGLATVDRPERPMPYDYRVRGIWRIADVRAWAFKLQRDVKRLQERIVKATPADKPALQAGLIDKLSELVTFTPFLAFLAGQAVDGELTLYGLKLGVFSAKRPLFDAPASLAAAHVGMAIPELDPATGDFQGETELAWPLRRRARTLVSETIPLGAAFGRSQAPKEQPFARVLNPLDPETGMAVMEVPEGPAGEPGAAGTATFVDRPTPERHDWRYGVTEVDPFGRWSPYTTTDHAWSYDVPPPPPVALSAELGQGGTPPTFVLTTRFSWPIDRFPAARHAFEVHLRRTPPPSGTPAGPAQWGRFERLAGTGAGPLVFDGTFSGSTVHDGMPVAVAFSDRTIADPSGNHIYRDFTVRLTGPQFARDAIDRASGWVAVRAVNDRGVGSDPLAGPARADHILETPPPTPSLPPDPLLAAYPDAERMSSFRLDWTGAADVRYTVLRAGEREIVQLMKDHGRDTSAYDPDGPANLRAAALKAFSAQCADAFQPRSGLIPDPPRNGAGDETDPKTWPPLGGGPRSFVDELPGRLRALSVYVVLGKSKAGVRSEWPTGSGAFAVVAVPQIPEPETPRAAGTWRPADDPSAPLGSTSARVEIRIARPAPETGAVTEYEVYRTLDPTRAGDHRTMRRIHGLAAPTFEPDGLDESATYVDPTVAPYRTYLYRVVARAARPGGASGGTRSEASSAIQVTTLSSALPESPTALASVRTATEVTVSFAANAPTTPAGDFVFEVRGGTLAQPKILARSTAAASRGAGGDYGMIVDPGAISTGDPFWVRIVDPLGSLSDSPPVPSS